MNKYTHALLLMLVLCLSAAGVSIAAAQGPSASAPDAENALTRVRIAHLAPFAATVSATRVTVSANGQSLGQFRYGDYSNFITLSGGAGTYEITITAGETVIATTSITLDEGKYSLLIVGGGSDLDVTAMTLAEDATGPAPGKTALRFAHVAPFANTLDGSRVDFCSVADKPFDNSSNGLPYRKASRFKDIPPGTYDNLKVSRANIGSPCTGALLMNVPAVTLPEGRITTLFFIGMPSAPAGGYNVFTFEDGIIGYVPEPDVNQVFLPMTTTSD